MCRVFTGVALAIMMLLTSCGGTSDRDSRPSDSETSTTVSPAITVTDIVPTPGPPIGQYVQPKDVIVMVDRDETVANDNVADDDTTGLGKAISASKVADVIANDTDVGWFTRYGTSSYWKESSAGYGGHMWWTYNNTATINNYAIWGPWLQCPGFFEVSAYIPNNNATTTKAKYTITHANGSSAYTINQNNYYNQWVGMGTYSFANSTVSVKLVDATGESYATKKIGFDAMRWSWKSASASLTVSSPNGGEAWYKSGCLPVSWNSSGLGDNVRIHLYRYGSIYKGLINNTANDGYECISASSFSDVSDGGGYTIGMSNVNSFCDGTTYDFSNGYFSISSPSITVNSPNGGESYVGTGTMGITWSSAGLSGNVRIELCQYGSCNITIHSNAANTGSYSWNILNIAGSGYQIRLTSVSDGSIWDQSNGTFTILPPPPPVATITTSSGNNFSTTQSSVQLEGACSDGNNDLDWIRYNNSATGWIFTDYAPSGGSYNFSQSISLAKGTNSIQVTCSDLLSAQSNDTITVTRYGLCSSGGYYCGGSVGENPNNLYWCSSYGADPSLSQDCQFGCQINPSGTNGVCKPNPCPGGKNGLYCGSQLGLSTNALYQCTDGTSTQVEACKAGCENSACKPITCTGTGWFCGEDLGLTTGALYHCSQIGGQPAFLEQCSSGCQQMSNNTDTCVKTGSEDLCQQIPSGSWAGEGAYCSGDNLLHCNSSKYIVFKEICALGCQNNATGSDDICIKKTDYCETVFWEGAGKYCKNSTLVTCASNKTTSDEYFCADGCNQKTGNDICNDPPVVPKGSTDFCTTIPAADWGGAGPYCDSNDLVACTSSKETSSRITCELGCIKNSAGKADFCQLADTKTTPPSDLSLPSLYVFFDEAAEKFGVPVDVLKAIAWHETYDVSLGRGWNQVDSIKRTAWCAANACLEQGYGIMQITNKFFSNGEIYMDGLKTAVNDLAAWGITTIDGKPVTTSLIREQSSAGAKANIFAGAIKLAGYGSLAGGFRFPGEPKMAVETWWGAVRRYNGFLKGNTDYVQKIYKLFYQDGFFPTGRNISVSGASKPLVSNIPSLPNFVSYVIQQAIVDNWHSVKDVHLKQGLDLHYTNGDICVPQHENGTPITAVKAADYDNDLIACVHKGEEGNSTDGSTGENLFTLDFPVAGHTASSINISAVLDHSPDGAYYGSKDEQIVTFKGEIARRYFTDAQNQSVDYGKYGSNAVTAPGYLKKNLKNSLILNHSKYEAAVTFSGISVKPIYYDEHPAYDYAIASKNVYAPASGVVQPTPEYDPIEGTNVIKDKYGTIIDPNKLGMLVLDHGNDYQSVFLHLGAFYVTTDQQVNRGNKLALSGNKGTGGYHLHYELRYKGKIVDPNGWSPSSDLSDSPQQTQLLSGPSTPLWSGKSVKEDCPAATAGPYCGSTAGLDPDILYDCKDGEYTISKKCGGNGCNAKPQGQIDSCRTKALGSVSQAVGGAVSGFDTAITVALSAQSASGDILITLSMTDPQAIGGALEGPPVYGEIYHVSAQRESDGDIVTQLASPMTLTLRLSAAALAAANDTGIEIAWRDPVTGQWTPLESTVNLVAATIETKTIHLGEFRIQGKPLVDTDADGIPNVSDNCSAKANASQNDVDKDGKGDACDSLNWAQLVAGIYTTYGNKDGITTDLFMANNGLSSPAQIGSLSGYSGASLVHTREIDGVVFDPSSNRVYFAEQYNNLVRHADLTTGIVTKDAGSGSVWLAGFLDGVGLSAKFNLPQQIAISADGQWLYIADYGNSVIRRMNTATQQVTTYAGLPGVAGYLDGPVTSAQFKWPRGVTVAGDNTVYVADSYNNAVRKISINGIVSTLFGGPGNVAGMIRPSGLTLIGNNLYVTDRLAHVIWKIDVNSGSGSVVVGKLDIAGTTDKVSGELARLGCPLGIDGKGTQLFVGDDCQNFIRQIEIANNYFTTILAGGASGFVDGAFSTAKFGTVQSVSYDPSANILYVADHYNLAIRRLHLDTGTVSTLVGAPEFVNRFADGEGPVARFGGPLDLVAIDNSNLLVADTGNCLIRKVTLDPNYGKVVGGKFNHMVYVTTFAGQKAGCPYHLDDITINTDDAPNGASALFYRPNTIAVDNVGQYAYVGSIDRTIRRLTLSTGATTWIAGIPKATQNQDGIGKSSSFSLVTDLIFTTEPALYILSKTAIRRLSLAAADYGTVTTVFGHLSESGTQDGTGTNARFTSLQDATMVNRNGVNYFYVTDAGANTIRAVNLQTNEVTTIAGNGTAGSKDGVGAQASFDTPLGITGVTFSDGAQYLYVGDFHTPKMRMIDLDTSEVTSISGSGNTGSTDGLGVQGDWSAIVSMLYLPQYNRIFILDHINSVLRQLTPDLPK